VSLRTTSQLRWDVVKKVFKRRGRGKSLSSDLGEAPPRWSTCLRLGGPSRRTPLGVWRRVFAQLSRANNWLNRFLARHEVYISVLLFGALYILGQLSWSRGHNVQLSSAWMGMVRCYLRSNIPLTALVATLDTYDFIIIKKQKKPTGTPPWWATLTWWWGFKGSSVNKPTLALGQDLVQELGLAFYPRVYVVYRRVYILLCCSCSCCSWEAFNQTC
jgi:hypothetical protein